VQRFPQRKNRMNPFQSNLWQDYGVLSKLYFNQALPGSPEGILRELGFVHLYAASGIHVYAFLTFLEIAAARFSKKIYAKWLVRAFGFFILACLWKLQGYRLGFARPILTFLIREFARARGVEWRIFYPLGITLLLDFIFHLDSGRAHYYLAILGGMVVAEYFTSVRAPKIFTHLGMAVGSWLATAGLDFFEFHQISWLTPLYSLITIPVISGLLYPITALSVLFWQPALPFLERLWSMFLNGCLFFAERGFTFSVVTRPAMIGGGLLSVAVGLIFYFIENKKWRIGMVVTLLFLAEVTATLIPATFADSFAAQLNVHQGDSALLRRRGRTEMIDVGSVRTWKSAEWIQKLSAHGVNHVDGVLLSHLDEDHVGALRKLIALLPVACVETNGELWRSEKGIKFAQKLRDVNPEVRLMANGCVQLPQVKWIRSTESREDGNGLMAGTVTPLDADTAYFALGDGDQSQEKIYANLFQEEFSQYPHKIWKVGHHGSRYSSDLAFLQQLHPDEVWLSVGKHNPYHHPHFETLWRLSEIPARLRRTDEEGDIVKEISN
jgi:competence protein ComEC